MSFAIDDPRLPPRFWRKVSPCPMSGCWLWTGAVTVGYGRVTMQRKQRLAHRVTYQTFVGEVPPGLVLDHRCNTPACCNPGHLRPATRFENLVRGKRRDKCPNGHALEGDNLIVIASKQAFGETRRCRLCREAWFKKHRRPTVKYDYVLNGGIRKQRSLSPDAVLEIRSSKERARDIAARFGVSEGLIYQVRSGRVYASVARSAGTP